MSTPIKTAAYKAIDEKHRLNKLYRARQRQEVSVACANAEYGPRVLNLLRALRRFTINDANAMIISIRLEARAWIRDAPEDIRALILRMIDDRIIRIRESNDLLPFDDPMPWQEDDVFRICKRELGL